MGPAGRVRRRPASLRRLVPRRARRRRGARHPSALERLRAKPVVLAAVGAVGFVGVAARYDHHPLFWLVTVLAAVATAGGVATRRRLFSRAVPASRRLIGISAALTLLTASWTGAT